MWIYLTVLALAWQAGISQAADEPPVSPNLRAPPSRSALFEYVNKPDDSYRYEKLAWSERLTGATAYRLNMTSQTWLTAKEVSNPVWWHTMVVVVPDQITNTETALLYIAGKSNNKVYEPTSNDFLYDSVRKMALATGTVTALLLNVPNQPTTFQDDPHKLGKYEDALLGWTWTQILKFPQTPEKAGLLPMVKAAVRGMDTVTDFAKKENSASNIKKFVVAGISKRGWTTWLTGVVDKRVVGIAPVAFDLLNFREVFRYNYRSLGGWSLFFRDYWMLNLTRYLDDPNFSAVTNLVDPFVYRDLLTMPKYIVKATGDEFFLLDNTYQYYKQLSGEKYIRNIDHTGHMIEVQIDTLNSALLGFYGSIVKGNQRPKVTWEFKYTATGGEIVMTTDVKPTSVSARSALSHSTTRRDFRATIFMMSPPFFQSKTLSWVTSQVTVDSDTQYSASFSNPSGGWRTCYIYATFQDGTNEKFEVTTESMIIPNTYPFPDCSGSSCYGSLVKK